MIFVVGVATAGYGGMALARWRVANWHLGSESMVFLVLVAVLLMPVALLLSVRRGRRIIAVGAVFFVIGVLAIGLYHLGFPSPASW